jgi:NifU-like protein involved in Fe-S cluster formation
MDYSDEVLRRFASQRYLRDGYQDADGCVAAESEDRALSFWVRFQLWYSDGRIDAIKYSVFGCPHAIAAVDEVADKLEGEPIASLLEWDPQAAARVLELPREKFGKLLRIEDALVELARRAGVGPDRDV